MRWPLARDGLGTKRSTRRSYRGRSSGRVTMRRTSPVFRGDLTSELNSYHPHGEAIVTSFVRGVNAYIAEALKNPSGLPAEFKTLDIVPAPWTPAVVISRHNALVANVEEEIKLAQAVRL